MSELQYKRVGPELSVENIELTLEGAQRFHELARVAFRTKHLSISDTETNIVSSTYLTGELSDAWADYSITSIVHISKTQSIRVPIDEETAVDTLAYDKSSIHFTKFRPSNRNSKFYTRYDVEQLGDELIAAKRNVRIIRKAENIHIGGGSDVYSTDGDEARHEFDRPIRDEDLDELEKKIRRLIARRTVGRG